MAAHAKRIERFENVIFKQREKINDRMTEMFGLLKELTTSRTPEKVLIRGEAKFPFTKNVNSISLARGEEEMSDKIDVATGDDIEKPTGTETGMQANEAAKENEDGKEEMIEVPRSQPVEYYLKHSINKKLIEGLIYNRRLSLASHSYIYPFGTAKDILVEVAEHVYPVDPFVILDIKEDERRPFIVGTPFLTTAKAVIKFDKGTITLRLVFEWEERIKLHLEREMEFNRWKSKIFKGKHPTLVIVEGGMDDEGEGTFGTIEIDGEDWKPPAHPHEVPLLTLTTTRVIEMDDPAASTDSSGVPSTIERSPLDFAHEAGISDHGTVSPEMPPSEDVPATDAPGASQAEEVAATDPPAATESRKRCRDGTDVNAPPKSLRRDHADPRPTGSAHGGKSLAAIQLGLASTHPVPVPENAPAGDPDSKNASSPVEVGSSESIYRPEWGVANGSLLDIPEACQDPVDHVTPSGYYSELCHLHNDEFLRQYNVNLARQVAMRSQLGLRFEQEAKLLRKSVAQVARRDQRIQARELEIKNLGALLETEANMKKAAEERSAGLSQELEDMRAWFSDLQAFADVVSTGIAKGISEGLRHGVEHGQAQLSLESIEAYDPEAEAKYVVTLLALKDLKYPLVDQLEGLKDAPMDVIMAAMYLESDTGDDAP
nr:hypothetical protein [Tanacetum cinerariifolium]